MRILALTTDPQDSIRGYSLAFQKICNNIDFADVTIVLNQGESNKLIKRHLQGFRTFKIPRVGYWRKGLYYVKKALRIIPQQDYDVVLSNSELPELITGLIYSKKHGKKNAVIIHDLRLRHKNLKTIIIHIIRLLLIRRYDKILVVNPYTAAKLPSNKTLSIGLPLCDENGKLL